MAVNFTDNQVNILQDLYRLHFQNGTFTLNGDIRLYEGNLFNESNAQLYAVLNSKLHCFRSEGGVWHGSVLASDHLGDVQQLYFADILGNGRDLMIAKQEEGIKFYQYEDNHLRLINQNNEFHDLYGWSESGSVIKFGRMYKDRTMLGLLAKNNGLHSIKFYGVMKQPLITGHPAIWPLKLSSLNIFGNSLLNETKLYLTDLETDGQDDVIVRSDGGLNVFRFDENNSLEHVLSVACCNDLFESNDQLFFSNLSGSKFKDVINFNSSGLYLHKYDETLKSYRFSNYNPYFSLKKGWQKQHTETIIFRDIDQDGADDLIFTGPQGVSILTYRISTDRLESLLDNYRLTAEERNSKVVQAVAFDSHDYSVFLANNNQLLAAAINRIQKEIIEEKISYDVSASFKKLEKIKVEPSKIYENVLYLRDQLDYSIFSDAVHRLSGKLKFIVPLVDITNLIINFKLVYDSMSSDILGFGWSFQRNLIMSSHQSSVFPEDTKYYLMYQQSLKELKLISSNSTGVLCFSFKDAVKDKSPVIYYHQKEEKWELIKGKVKQIYGKADAADAEAAVLKEKTWKYWRGKGDSSDQVEIPCAWYLSEVSDQYNNIARFSYLQRNKLNSAKAGITMDVYLKEISDNNGNTIKLKYQPTSDYELKNKSKTKNQLALYLSGYILNSAIGNQDVDFLYTLKNSRRLLTAIVQKDDAPALEFSYNEHYLISSINFLQDGHVDISYTKQALAPWSGPTKITSAYRGYEITTGSNYIIISYVNRAGQLEMKIFDEEMKEQLYSPSSATIETRLPVFGRDKTVYPILAHQIIEGRNFLALIISYKNSTELIVFSVNKGKINVSPTSFTYSEQSIIRFGEDFVVVVDNSSELIERNGELNLWTKRRVDASDKSQAAVAAYERMFVIYNNRELTLWYRDRNQAWQARTIQTISNLMADVSNSLKKFSMSDQLIDLFRYYSANKILQFSNNMILLNSWQLRDYTIYSVIKLLLLNSNYEVADKFEKSVAHEDIRTFTKEIKAADSSFKCRYVLENGKFKFSVFNYTGRYYDDIEADKKKEEREIQDANASTEAKNKALDDLNKSAQDFHEEVMKNVTKAWGKDIFLFDNVYQDYHATLNPPDTIAGNYIYHFDGSRWEEKTHEKADETSITLGDDYIVYKEKADSSIKLYKQNRHGDKEGNYIKDLGTKYFNETIIKYPFYLAFKPPNGGSRLIEFSSVGDIADDYTLPSEEKLSLSSGHQGLFTDTGYDSVNMTKLHFRPIIGIRRLSPDIVISQTTVTFNDGIKRFTGFEYNTSSAEALESSVYYGQTELVPGNDRQSFGWIKETTEGNSTSKQIFNGYGGLVKTVAEDQDNDRDQEVVLSNTTIFDKYDRDPVAFFFPYSIDDEIVNYYGFEDYEVNSRKNQRSDTKKRWIFNETNIIRNSFSFTGKNYLNLKDNGFLQGSYNLGNSSLTFVASSWVRPHFEMPGLGSTVPYMKIVAGSADSGNGIGILSEVKLRSGPWYYLESVINLFYTRMNINTELTNATSSRLLDNIGIHIIIGGAANGTMDVDHVRFSPINCRFKGLIYDWTTRTITEEIRFNGLVKKYVYDKYKEKIATISEYGVINDFRTYSKVSSRGAFKQPASNILIKPENGFYEDFSPDSMAEHWAVSDENAFHVSPGYIEHIGSATGLLSLKQRGINTDSFAIRFIYHIQTNNAAIDLKFAAISRNNGGCYYHKKSEETTSAAPCNGELLLLSERGRLVTWLDGGLYEDAGDQPLLNTSNGTMGIMNIALSGLISIRQLMIFNNLNLQVIYFNAIGEKIQEIKLEDESNVIVTAYLYDPIGRQSITTKPIRINRSAGQKMLAYYSNLVANGDPYALDSVWKTGTIKGGKYEGGAALGEYDYMETKYNNDPLEVQRTVGYPGKDFSTHGPYSTKYAPDCDILFIKNLYPAREGYRYATEYKAGGLVEVLVFDNRNNQVARYLQANGGKQLLSTYEYDSKNRLTKLLPPMYHEKAGTFFKLYSVPHSPSDEDFPLQQMLGTHLTYDEHDNILTKTTPDSGKIENIHDTNGLLKFVVYYDFNDMKKVDKILYFNYDDFFRVTSSGLLGDEVPVANLLSTIHNNTMTFQEFYYNDGDFEPTSRGRIKRTITFNDKVPFIEQVELDDDKHVLNRRITLPLEIDKPIAIDINKRFAGSNMVEIEYPIEFQNEALVLKYEYNKLGKIKSIGFNKKLSLFNFKYNPSGHLASVHHAPSSIHSFTRLYSYNSPGFPTKIQDKYLTENIYYTEPGYGGYGYGDGTITRTEFVASWHDYSNIYNFHDKLNDGSFKTNSMNEYESRYCFDRLKEAGYIDSSNHQTRILYPELDFYMPVVCSYGTTGRYVANILGRKGFPERYGHIYDYGNHLELTKAKYFVGDQVPPPLQPDTFAKEIKAINRNVTMSHEIWQLLRDSQYLIEDRDKNDFSTAHSKRGKPFINPSLIADLRKIDAYGIILNVSKLLSSLYSNRQTLSKSEFLKLFSKWKTSYSDEYDIGKAEKVFEMLQKENYFENPLDGKILNKLKKFKHIMPEIIKILWEYFGRELGEAEFDVESYEIDSNGNHKHYYTGFDRFEIDYSNNTNRIEAIKFKSFASSLPQQRFEVEHDSRGNVVKALHKGIKRIKYNAVMNRASKIELVDGRVISFLYDANGERILKRVQDSEGYTVREVHYIRDELGRSLVEREFTYVARGKAPDMLTTAYIYGPNGLIGFMRRDEFYSVICDHEFSVRLIEKNGEVVAAYDYLPYGATMRHFSSYPEADISYRYTGQEWDEELGLYNYHVRLYDPSIGRFLQIDPKEQYFSPYKYAGNSPISKIDPDGQFAFIFVFIAIGALIGGFLGGAAANGTFNITKWNFKSGKTWLGIFSGALMGGTLPLGISGSVAAFTALGLSQNVAIAATVGLGIAGAYVNTAIATRQPNFLKWNYKSPLVLNSLFGGFAGGSGLAGGFHSAREFYLTLSTKGRRLFVGASAVTAGGMFTLQGFANNWDFSSPDLWLGIVESIINAPDLPRFMRGASKFLSKNGRTIGKNFSKIKQFIKEEGNYFSHFSKMKGEWIPIGKSVGKLSGAVLVTGLTPYLVGSAVNDDFKNWDMKSPGTYQAILNGIQTGDQLNQIAIGGAKYYKLYKAEQKTKVAKLSEKVAKETVETYQPIIDEIKRRLNSKNEDPSLVDAVTTQSIDPKKYGDAIKNKLKAGKIPNTVVGVGISDKFVISAFSTNDAPGLVLLFTHKKMSSATFVQKKFLEHNLKIAGKDVKLSENPATNDYLINRIRETQNAIKESVIPKYLEKFDVDKPLIEKAIKKFTGMSDESVEAITSILKNKIREDAHIKDAKATVTSVLTDYFNKAAQDRIKPLSMKLGKTKATLNKKKNELKEMADQTSEQYKNLKEEIDKMEKTSEDMLKNLNEEKKLIISERTKSIDEITNIFEDYGKELTHWSEINCAEPHVLTTFARIKEVFSDIANGGTFNDKATDIKYMAAYKVNEDLKPYPRCDNCKITTEHIKHVITDPDGWEILNGNLLRSIKGDLSVLNLYFLIPYKVLLAQFLRSNTTDGTRPKREILPEHQIDPRAYNNIEDEVLDNYATSEASRNTPYLNTIFGWFKDSVNKFIKITGSNSYSEETESESRNESISGKWSSSIDINSSLLLLNVVVAKIFDNKLISFARDDFNRDKDALVHALNITDRFEHLLKETIKNYNHPSPDSILHDADFYEIQSVVHKKLMTNKFNDINGVLKLYSQSIYPADNPEYTETINRERFLDELNENIDQLIDDYLHEITAQEMNNDCRHSLPEIAVAPLYKPQPDLSSLDFSQMLL